MEPNEVENLKQELEKVKKEFNDYKIGIQGKVIPKYENYRRIFDEANEELESVKLKNDALINFINKNGLGAEYYQNFVENFYPYDCLPFKSKNEVNISALDKGKAINALKYYIEKGYNQN